MSVAGLKVWGLGIDIFGGTNIGVCSALEKRRGEMPLGVRIPLPPPKENHEY